MDHEPSLTSVCLPISLQQVKTRLPDSRAIDRCHACCLQVTENSVEPADVASQVDRARRIVDSRLLTQDEFKRIEARQMSKQISVDKRVDRTAKRSRSDADDALHQEYVLYLLYFIIPFDNSLH